MDGADQELTSSSKYSQEMFGFFSQKVKKDIFNACLKHICMILKVCHWFRL